MATAYHVPGPVVIKPGTGAGSPPAQQVLGVSEDGVDISIKLIQEAVRADSVGPGGTADIQQINAEATIRAAVAVYDMAVLATLRKMAMASTVDGTLGAPGALLGTGGFLYKLTLSSQDEPWRFQFCTLADAQDTKLGTKNTVWRCVWRAIGYVPGTTLTSSGVVLYDHTDA